MPICHPKRLILNHAVIIAVGVNDDGRREVLGMTVGASEAETFWIEFLRSLADRGLRGVKLVISDAHEGLKAAIRRVMGTSWQRCYVHTIRTQSTIGRADWAAPARRRVAQRNNMPDLQTALVHDDALDDELQDGLLVGKRSIIEPAADALAECAEVSQDRLRAHLFAA